VRESLIDAEKELDRVAARIANYQLSSNETKHEFEPSTLDT